MGRERFKPRQYGGLPARLAWNESNLFGEAL